MKNNQIGGFNAIKLQQVSHWPTRDVHKSIGLGNDELGASGAHPTFCYQGICFV